jgi:hypothetical protein
MMGLANKSRIQYLEGGGDVCRVDLSDVTGFSARTQVEGNMQKQGKLFCMTAVGPASLQ